MLIAAISASETTMPLGYWPVSSSQRTVRPVLVVVAEINSDDDPVADEGLGAPVLADEGEQPVLASRPGESHPRALLEPCVNLSIHTAPDVRLWTCRKHQWAKRLGCARTTRANQSRAPFGLGRRRLNLLRAQRSRKASIRRNVQDSADL